MKALGLLRVGISEGLRGSFEEVLVVAHLSYGNAVELICMQDKVTRQHGGTALLKAARRTGRASYLRPAL